MIGTGGCRPTVVAACRPAPIRAFGRRPALGAARRRGLIRGACLRWAIVISGRFAAIGAARAAAIGARVRRTTVGIGVRCPPVRSRARCVAVGSCGRCRTVGGWPRRRTVRARVRRAVVGSCGRCRTVGIYRRHAIVRTRARSATLRSCARHAAIRADGLRGTVGACPIRLGWRHDRHVGVARARAIGWNRRRRGMTEDRRAGTLAARAARTGDNGHRVLAGPGRGHRPARARRGRSAGHEGLALVRAVGPVFRGRVAAARQAGTRGETRTATLVGQGRAGDTARGTRLAGPPRGAGLSAARPRGGAGGAACGQWSVGRRAPPGAGGGRSPPAGAGGRPPPCGLPEPTCGPPGPARAAGERPPAGAGAPGRGLPGCGRAAPGSTTVRSASSPPGPEGPDPAGPGRPATGPPPAAPPPAALRIASSCPRIRATSDRSASRCRTRSASSARTDSRSARAAAWALPRISAASSSAAARMFCMRSVKVPIGSPSSPRRALRGPGTEAGTGRRRGQAGAEPRWRHERKRLATSRLKVGTHPPQNPLQPRDVLVDLLPVVAAQNDVEAWGAWPPHISRHRDALPLVSATSTRVGIIRFPQPARSLRRSIPNRYRSPAGGVLPQVSQVMGQ